MDTRRKILTAAQAAQLARQKQSEGIPVSLLAGYFDPLLAAHVRRVEELAQPGACLFAVVENPREPLLPARARAELVAGLRVIDYVVLPEDAGAESLKAEFPGQVFDGKAADEVLTRGLIAHVHSRHQ